LELRTKV